MKEKKIPQTEWSLLMEKYLLSWPKVTEEEIQDKENKILEEIKRVSFYKQPWMSAENFLNLVRNIKW